MAETIAKLALKDSVPPPHGGEPILVAGVPLDAAQGAMVLVHGRGATARDILELRHEWHAPGFCFVSPQAADSTWYPYRFLAPLAQNEPHLSSGLALLKAISDDLCRRGVPSERQILLGFSQGGCLTLEFSGQNARRWGGVVGLSAGFIGPPGRRWGFPGSLLGTPVFLGCSDHDPHIPRERVEESAAELERIGGQVDLRIYAELGHTINKDELDHVQRIIDRLEIARPA